MPLTDADTQRLVDMLSEVTGARILVLRSTGNDLVLHHITLPRNKRNQGHGSLIMRSLVAHADERGMRMRLTPALKDDNWGTTSRARLVRFYKRFGFVENKGRNKDFTLGPVEMYRDPKRSAGRSSGRALTYRFNDPPEYADSDYKKRGGKLVTMPPEEFLRRTGKPLRIDEESRDNIDSLKAHIKSGRALDPPTLYIRNGKVVHHDGRHRSHAAIELGIRRVPVLLIPA